MLTLSGLPSPLVLPGYLSNSAPQLAFCLLSIVLHNGLTHSRWSSFLHWHLVLPSAVKGTGDTVAIWQSLFPQDCLVDCLPGVTGNRTQVTQLQKANPQLVVCVPWRTAPGKWVQGSAEHLIGRGTRMHACSESISTIFWSQ